MAAGPMRKRITFQQEVKAPDGAGGHDLSWIDLTTVWGSFKPERGTERVEAGRLEDSLRGVIKVRSSSITRQVTAGFRAMIDGQPYNLGPPSNPDQRNRYLEFVAERGSIAT
ncbi:MAG: phage head closure protein [Pseudomonadota bacterium]